MKKNIKTALLRTYIVFSVCWSIWWLYRFGDAFDGIMDSEIIINSFAPIPLYFAFRWILNSFEN